MLGYNNSDYVRSSYLPFPTCHAGDTVFELRGSKKSLPKHGGDMSVLCTRNDVLAAARENCTFFLLFPANLNISFANSSIFAAGVPGHDGYFLPPCTNDT